MLEKDASRKVSAVHCAEFTGNTWSGARSWLCAVLLCVYLAALNFSNQALGSGGEGAEVGPVCAEIHSIDDRYRRGFFYHRGKSERFATPLVIDLDGDGLDLVDLNMSGAFFDIDVDGFAERSGWVKSDDGLLVLDRNFDGFINNLTELFGEQFVPPSMSVSAEGKIPGFSALEAYDYNADGLIDRHDPVFDALRVWVDVTESAYDPVSKMKSLHQLGITEIRLDPEVLAQECAGNKIVARASIVRNGIEQAAIFDVLFRYNPSQTRHRPSQEQKISPEIKALPWTLGSGEVLDLDAAMARDPWLKAMMEDLIEVSSETLYLFPDAVEKFLVRWYRVEHVDPLGRGGFINGRHLAAIERHQGFPFRQRGVEPDPRPHAAAAHARNWRKILAITTARLFAQTEFGSRLGFSFPLAAVVKVKPEGRPREVVSNLSGKIPRDQGRAIRHWYAVALILYAASWGQSEGPNEYTQAINEAIGRDLPFGYLDLLDAFVGGDGDDVLIGRSSSPDRFLVNNGMILGGDDIFYSGPGNDQLVGGAGSDTYVFAAGDGLDIIQEGSIDQRRNLPATSRADKILFLDGIIPGEVSLTCQSRPDAPPDVQIEYGTQGDQIVVRDFFELPWPKIQTLDFADGTSIDLGSYMNLAWRMPDGKILCDPRDQVDWAVIFLEGLVVLWMAFTLLLQAVANVRRGRHVLDL